jgi:hypothetical protein
VIGRRDFLTAAGLTAAGAVVAPSVASAATSRAPHLTALIGNQTVPRDEVLQWEARRLQVVTARINHNLLGTITGELDSQLLHPAVSTSTVARDRERLADLKMRLGEAQMRKLTSLDQAVSDPTAALLAAPKEWTFSRTTIVSDAGTARGFVDWFNGRIARNDVRAMLVACPDHYVIRTPGPSRQEVIEVTGGAVFASRFLINYTDDNQLPIPADPRYPARAAGWARNAHGTRIGAVHHQFRDNPGRGFTGALAIAFPAFLPPTMISEHRWHLACEFSNWITAYAAAQH